MNEVMKALLERRSIRSFKSEMPPREDIEQIIEAGLYAPSARNEQAAIVVAVTNKELRDRLSRDNCRIGGWSPDVDPFYGAPVVLIAFGRKDWKNRVADASLVMGNMLLAAHALGLGGIWINRAKEEFDMPEYQQVLKDLGVEGEWEGVGHCCVGYIDGDMPAPAPRKPGRVFWAE